MYGYSFQTPKDGSATHFFFLFPFIYFLLCPFSSFIQKGLTFFIEVCWLRLKTQNERIRIGRIYFIYSTNSIRNGPPLMNFSFYFIFYFFTPAYLTLRVWGLSNIYGVQSS